MNGDKLVARINFTKEIYQNIAETYASLLPENKNEDYVININWALKKLGAKEQ